MIHKASIQRYLISNHLITEKASWKVLGRFEKGMLVLKVSRFTVSRRIGREPPPAVAESHVLFILKVLGFNDLHCRTVRGDADF